MLIGIICLPMSSLHGFLCSTSFCEEANTLLLSAGMQFDAPAARSLLARAPWTSKEVYGLYGRVLVHLLTKTTVYPAVGDAEVDGLLLAEYLNGFCLAMDTPVYPNEEAEFSEKALLGMSVYSEPSRQGLEFIRVYIRVALQKASDSANRLLKKMSDHPLTAVITSLQGEKEAHPALRWALLNNAIDIEPLFIELSQEHVNPTMLLWGAIAPFVLNGEWMPRNEDEAKRLLYAHINPAIDRRSGALVNPLLLRKILDSNVLALHTSLECIFNSFNVSEAIVEEYFPLRLMGCDRSYLLRVLLKITTADDGFRCDLNKIFTDNLERNHYMLALALLVHIGQSANAEVAVDTSDFLLETFELIYGNPLPHEEKEEDRIDGRIFE